MNEEPDEPGSGGEPAPPPRPAGVPTVPAEPLERQRRRHTRRWFLAGAGAVLVGAGGGVAAAFGQRRPRPVPHPPPQLLVDAYVAEQRLVASAAATARAAPAEERVVLAQLRRDHEAHSAALRAELARFDHPSRVARRRATALAGRTVTTPAALAALEARAAGQAAGRANELAASHPVPATVLASIAGCESGHVQLLR